MKRENPTVVSYSIGYTHVNLHIAFPFLNDTPISEINV